MSASSYITFICGTQNQNMKFEESFDSLCKKIKQMFHLDWNITSLLCDGKEIKDQISYNEYINKDCGLPLEINSSFDVLQDYIEDTIRDYLDKKYEELFVSIKEYIKTKYSEMTITQFNSTLKQIIIEPNYSKVSFKSIQEKPKNNAKKQAPQKTTNNISSKPDTRLQVKNQTTTIHALNNSLIDTSFNQSNNISNIGIMTQDQSINDSFRKERFRLQQKKKTLNNHQIVKTKQPITVSYNNPVAISSSAFLNEINKDFKIYKKFGDTIIEQCYKKNNSVEEYLLTLYKQNYITLDDFSFDKIETN